MTYFVENLTPDRIKVTQSKITYCQKRVYSGNADLFCPKRRFRTVFESYRFMPFQTPFEGKNGV